MNLQEHLLTILAEECNEVAQRTSKALRFGLSEVQKGSEFTNAERIMREFAELLCLYQMLQHRGCLPPIDAALVKAKEAKVIKFLAYAEECHTLQLDIP